MARNVSKEDYDNLTDCAANSLSDDLRNITIYVVKRDEFFGIQKGFFYKNNVSVYPDAHGGILAAVPGASLEDNAPFYGCLKLQACHEPQFVARYPYCFLLHGYDDERLQSYVDCVEEIKCINTLIQNTSQKLRPRKYADETGKIVEDRTTEVPPTYRKYIDNDDHGRLVDKLCEMANVTKEDVLIYVSCTNGGRLALMTGSAKLVLKSANKNAGHNFQTSGMKNVFTIDAWDEAFNSDIYSSEVCTRVDLLNKLFSKEPKQNDVYVKSHILSKMAYTHSILFYHLHSGVDNIDTIAFLMTEIFDKSFDVEDIEAFQKIKKFKHPKIIDHMDTIDREIVPIVGLANQIFLENAHTKTLPANNAKNWPSVNSVLEHIREIRDKGRKFKKVTSYELEESDIVDDMVLNNRIKSAILLAVMHSTGYSASVDYSSHLITKVQSEKRWGWSEVNKADSVRIEPFEKTGDKPWRKDHNASDRRNLALPELLCISMGFDPHLTFTALRSCETLRENYRIPAHCIEKRKCSECKTREAGTGIIKNEKIGCTCIFVPEILTNLTSQNIEQYEIGQTGVYLINQGPHFTAGAESTSYSNRENETYDYKEDLEKKPLHILSNKMKELPIACRNSIMATFCCGSTALHSGNMTESVAARYIPGNDKDLIAQYAKSEIDPAHINRSIDSIIELFCKAHKAGMTYLNYANQNPKRPSKEEMMKTSLTISPSTYSLSSLGLMMQVMHRETLMMNCDLDAKMHLGRLMNAAQNNKFNNEVGQFQKITLGNAYTPCKITETGVTKTKVVGQDSTVTIFPEVKLTQCKYFTVKQKVLKTEKGENDGNKTGNNAGGPAWGTKKKDDLDSDIEDDDDDGDADNRETMQQKSLKLIESDITDVPTAWFGTSDPVMSDIMERRTKRIMSLMLSPIYKGWSLKLRQFNQLSKVFDELERRGIMRPKLAHMLYKINQVFRKANVKGGANFLTMEDLAATYFHSLIAGEMSNVNDDFEASRVMFPYVYRVTANFNNNAWMPTMKIPSDGTLALAEQNNVACFRINPLVFRPSQTDNSNVYSRLSLVGLHKKDVAVVHARSSDNGPEFRCVMLDQRDIKDQDSHIKVPVISISLSDHMPNYAKENSGEGGMPTMNDAEELISQLSLPEATVDTLIEAFGKYFINSSITKNKSDEINIFIQKYNPSYFLLIEDIIRGVDAIDKPDMGQRKRAISEDESTVKKQRQNLTEN